MKNIVDLVQTQTELPRDVVEKVLTSTMMITKAELQAGNEVFWPGLCRFTWKVTAKTKKLKAEPENPEDKGLGAKQFKVDKEEKADEHGPE